MQTCRANHVSWGYAQEVISTLRKKKAFNIKASKVRDEEEYLRDNPIQ